MLLHYVGPCIVPVLERRFIPSDAPTSKTAWGRWHVLIFPIANLAVMGLWTTLFNGRIGPGTVVGLFWSIAWIIVRTATAIGTRKVILEQGTLLWDRQLYQTLPSLCILVIIGFLTGIGSYSPPPNSTNANFALNVRSGRHSVCDRGWCPSIAHL